MLNRRKYLLLCAIILLIFLLISGCSTIIFGPSGSIEVTTNPSGANIFIDGKDTGKTSPDTLKNVSVGSHIIEVTLSDMKYIETVEVKAYQATDIHIEFYSQITLDKINVLPYYTTITLSLGNTISISTVTAYYSDYSSANIPLTNCTYSSNDDCVTVNSSGTVTGISAGAAIITVSYTEEGITKTDTVLVYVRDTPTDTPVIPPVGDDIVYRALLVGVGDYINGDPYPGGDLDGPPENVDRIRQILEQCKFGSSNTIFSSINDGLIDFNATKTAILDGIDSTFFGADDNDVSYFYFAGHGYLDPGTNISYLCPADDPITTLDLNALISVNTLESHLSAIPGTKVVILDTCYSGGFIGKGKRIITISKAELLSFNEGVINTFSQTQSKVLLTTNQYKVLTSCHDYQTSTYIIPVVPGAFEPFGIFTMALCLGCGYDSFISPYPADNNEDNKVSLQEAYLYIESTLESSEQDVQVHPSDSDFIVVEY